MNAQWNGDGGGGRKEGRREPRLDFVLRRSVDNGSEFGRGRERVERGLEKVLRGLIVMNNVFIYKVY